MGAHSSGSLREKQNGGGGFFFGPILASLVGCSYFVSWNDLGESWIGNDIDKIVDLWGAPDEVGTMDNGLSEYKYSLKNLDPSCVHYWIVDQGGTITGFHYEGRCSPI